MDFADIFNGKDEPEALPEVVEPPVETPPAPAEVEAPPAPEPAPEVVEADPEKEVKQVPLATFLDARDRAKEAERKAADLEARLASQTAPAAPDPNDDPQGYLQAELTRQRFEISDVLARKEHGDEAVKAAADWATERARTDPAFASAYMQQPMPIDWIVREHKRSGLLNEIGDNVDDWFVREAAKRGYAPSVAPTTAAAPAVAAPPTAVNPPPRSIASDAPASTTTGDPSADFMAIFKR